MRKISTTLQMGTCIRDRRLELGMTQEDLAKRSGVSKRTLHSLEKGSSTGIRLDKLRAVLGALDLELYVGTASSSSLSYREAMANLADRLGSG